ncbi:PEP/pyruvate-binding domain-containing protein [Saccharothrix luteola]|uniref:PEP/pyruvate-binding domain-containing protein n=1 Tax=Saccharothrix luteola TaxID=2893018 RepID=UPI001E2DB8A9|nr:PEP/pyruvate-binding domain-containing protein [Saccharothrix luteola]MCC8246547.1 pyruvate, phosphate dikinase [Saccharothrix luteola]MCC8248401.1 pyruvate, phosphate dikinase [Saccharothrix luteola]
MGTTALVLPLADPTADLETVGGKGASLARLAAAGLPVPAGFHLTTHAYRRATEGLDAGTRAGRGGEAAIAAAFERLDIPADIADAIRAALPPGPVAVRSSATAEDLPDLSFAGQHDTFLDVSGDEVLDAVKRCWASLWTARAVAYRARNGITDVALAVVVQEMVPADAAGVLFTANPVTGARTETVVNAAPGLGEALVGGTVTPDEYIVSADGVVRGSGGSLLSDAQVRELAGLGARIQDLYGVPMDVEWAVAGGRIAVLQARPITALPEVWNDTLRGDYLWTCANLREAVPSVMSPATWSFARVLAQPPIAGHPTSGNIGGRFYLNLSAALAVGRALGLNRFLWRTVELYFGRVPAGVEVPPLPLSRPAVLRAAIGAALPFLRQNREFRAKIDGLLASAPGRAERLHAAFRAASTPAELLALWKSDVHDVLHVDAKVFDAGARNGSMSSVKLRRKLAGLVGEDDTTALLTGAHGAAGELESLGPVLGLARLKRGEITREAYVRLYGHRFADEFEVSAPRPAEDPGWPRTDDVGVDPEELLARQAAVRDAAWERLRAAHPGKVDRLRREVDGLAALARERERARSEFARTFAVLRAFLVRAGEVTGHGDAVFFLPIEETLRVLDGDETPLASVPARGAAYDRYRALPPYPTVIRGRFDPEAWAADPDRRTDVHAAAAEPLGDAVSGFPGAAGVVEGVARVIQDVADAAALRPGEILVTTVTNIGWTPLFPRAAAVVTDVGAPLSHAAIVARELGIPAVVGCGNATTRIRTGDRVRVDGGRGAVTVLG